MKCQETTVVAGHLFVCIREHVYSEPAYAGHVFVREDRA